MQYDAGVGDFNSGRFTPFPATLSRGRVSVEEAPVEILAPEDSVFHYPNQITQRDFDGWVQERGLYFMSQWDSHFRRCFHLMIQASNHSKAGCCGRNMARAHTSTPDTHSFVNCLPAFRERFGCM